MKKLLLPAFWLLFAAGMLLPQSNYKQIKIHLNDPQKDIPQLAQYGLEVDHSVTTKDNDIILFVSDEEFSKISILGYPTEVLIDDWYSYFAAQAKMSDAEIARAKMESSKTFGVTGFGYGSLGGFYTWAEMAAQLDSLRLRFPNLITVKQSIGNSVENRPLWMVKISDNPELQEAEPQVFYSAMHHAREPGGMMALLYFMYYLLENYGTKPDATYLVNNRELYFVPCVNPDGYEYNRTTNPSGGGMWRKNRKNNGSNYGVDLNRNYGPYEYWNANNGGSSTTSSDDTYRGTAPFSEPETQAVRDFLATKNFRNGLNYHTYGKYLIFPYGAKTGETRDSVIFRDYSAEMTRVNNYTRGTDLQTVNYSTRGNSDDFFYDGDTVSRGKIFAMTPEVGSGGFWPAQSYIFPDCQDMLMPNLFYAWVGGEYISLTNKIFSRQYINPGDTASISAALANRGLGTAKNVRVELTTLSPYITVTAGTALADSIPARGTKPLAAPFRFSVAPNAPIDNPVKLLLSAYTGTTLMNTDTVSLILGTPQFFFKDTANAPTVLWTITGSPTTAPKWDAATDTFYSGPNSYTDSKGVAYNSSATITLSLTNPINLAGANNPRLTFYTRYDIETKWDCGVVQISTDNGSTWTVLQGTYTKPASGSGKQVPAGMPMYDGLRTEWVKEEIPLAAYAGRSIKLRFELRTDGSIVKGGWFIDDIGILTYTGTVPVELTTFTANAGSSSVTLNWKTATELNNAGFTVQRSSGTQAWQSIGDVTGAGTSTEARVYTFTDTKPAAGNNRYRLLQHDFDGTTREYGPVEADFSGVAEYELSQNYPNPFNPATAIRFAIPQAGKVTLAVYDALGRQAAVPVSGWYEAGRYTVTFNASAFPSGVYFYELRAGTYTARHKMTLTK